MNPEYSLERLMLKLKLQYFGYLMRLIGKPLFLVKIEGRRRRGAQGISRLNGIIDSTDMHLSKLREMVKDREDWRVVMHGITKCRI